MYTDIGGSQPCENVLTDSSVSGGNSGSPILDIDGKVIGILSYGYSVQDDLNGGTSQFIMQRVVEKIIIGNGIASTYTDSDGDYTKKGWLGIAWTPVGIADVVNKGLVGSFNMRGINVNSISIGGGIAGITGPAMATGSIILDIDGIELGDKEGQIAPGSVTWLKLAGATASINYMDPMNTFVSAIVTLGNFQNAEDFPLNNGANI